MQEPSDDDAKTEAPSARALRRARERGDVPRSPLASLALAWLAGCALVTWGGRDALRALEGLASWALSLEPLGSAPGEPLAAGAALLRAGALGLSLVAAPLGALAFAGALAALLVGGLSFSPRALGRRGGRQRIGRASLEGLGALAVALAVSAVAGAGTLEAIRGLAGRAAAPPGWLAEVGLGSLSTIGWRVGAVLAVLGAIAGGYRRWRWWRDQRMSRRERAREARETEGDPLAKRRRGRLHRDLAEAPGLAQLAAEAALLVRADGVVVALRWPDRDATPEVSRAIRGPAAARLIWAAPAVPRAHDPGLALALARLPGGAAVPSSLWPRLARHLARAERGA